MIIAVLVVLFLGIICASIGIIAGFPGVMEKNEFQKNSVPVSAQIYDIKLNRKLGGTGRHTFVHVIFNTEKEEEVTARLHTYWSSMEVGQDIDIFYLRDDPSKVTIEKSSAFYMVILIVFGGLGFLLIISAIMMAVSENKKIKMQIRIKATGSLVKAVVIGITDYKLEAEYNGVKYYSNFLSLSDSVLENMKLPETVDVYIDRLDVKNYFMDFFSTK